jgi:hypothetical protein
MEMATHLSLLRSRSVGARFFPVPIERYGVTNARVKPGAFVRHGAVGLQTGCSVF